jgi:hypothetical protein
MGMDCSSDWHRAGRHHPDLAGSLDKTTPLQRDSHSLSEDEGERQRKGVREREREISGEGGKEREGEEGKRE